MNDFGEVLENVSLKDYSSFGIGGNANYLIKPRSEKELQKLIKYLKKENIKYIILGNGTNTIIDDSNFDGVVIKFDYFNEININNNIVTAGAGVSLGRLANASLKEDLTSLTFASMIPGNVGGSIVGNAGAYGHELMEYVQSVRVMDYDGNIYNLPKDDISFGYRYTSLKGKYIVLSATFILSKGNREEATLELKERNAKRITTQPLDKKNVGSIFRNPEGYSAGKLIDDLGLKGIMIGGAKISEKHANFIVNENNATFEDVLNLIKIIKEKVKETYNIDLVLEPNIIKWNEL